jgi:hypothetical protein
LTSQVQKSQVQSEHRVAPAGEGSANDAISVRVRKQLSVLRAIRRNQQYFFLANSSYCFLVVVNDVSAVPRLRSDDDDGTTTDLQAGRVLVALYSNSFSAAASV